MLSPKPQNPHGKIVKLETPEDCLVYLSEADLETLSAGLGANRLITHYLPFSVEVTQVDSFTVSQDLVYSGLPQIIRCSNLIFDGGSITSFVQLVIKATTTALQKTGLKNYQVMLSGSPGSTGTTGVGGQSGPNGTNGQSKSCEDAQNGTNGQSGFVGGNGGPGGNGTGTPVSSLAFGSIQLTGQSLLTVIAQGGNGGNGGTGGTGGNGGSGGNGGNSTSTGCHCYTNGGNGGNGGSGGNGGPGGIAGSGSNFNQSMTITVVSQADRVYLSTNPIAGSPGLPGAGGNGGTGGTGGSGGSGTKHGHGGSAGSKGSGGNKGGDGTAGSNGALPQISVNVGS
jgi:hypothetical protein